VIIANNEKIQLRLVLLKSSLFPVGCHSHWFKPKPEQLTALEQDWLLSQDSLTAKLKAAGQQFNVDLLGQKQLTIDKHEEQLVGNIDTSIVREVLLYCNNRPWVFARTIIPEQLQDDGSSIFKNLGNQALGERLFQAQHYPRSEFQIASFKSTSSIHQLAKKLGYTTQQALWGRRSCFIIKEQTLLVQEIFLPPASLYSHKEFV